MDHFSYVGTELELFQHAKNWKEYYGSLIQPRLRGRVLEVGGGIGGTTQHLCDGNQDQWTVLEPDPALMREMRERFRSTPLPIPTVAVEGTLESLEPSSQFDAILYIDILEHIEDDHAELRNAAVHLAAGGSLIVLAPAHQFLYSPFDKAIGHFRRYSRKSLRAVGPSGLRLDSLRYLDSVGMAASLGNRLLLKAAQPTLGQIKFWDSTLVRLSRLVDPLFGFRVGKSVIAVWSKPSP